MAQSINIQDASGQWWQLTVTPGGIIQTTQIPPPTGGGAGVGGSTVTAMPSVTSITARIQSLVDDPGGSYTTPDFLLPLINQKYEELYNRLRLTGADFDEGVIELLDVIPNTVTLASYQGAGSPLALLVTPTMLEWKLAGTQSINYLQADYLEKVRDVVPGQLIDSWEFRQNIINLTPATAAMDIRVTGHFLLPLLNDPAAQLQIGQNITHIISYMVASLIGDVRGNDAWSKTYQMHADACFDDLAQLLSRSELQKVYRVARASRSQQWRRTPF